MLLTGSLAEDGDDAELYAGHRDVVFTVLEMAPCCSPAAPPTKMEIMPNCTPAALLKMRMTRPYDVGDSAVLLAGRPADDEDDARPCAGRPDDAVAEMKKTPSFMPAAPPMSPLR